MAEPGSWPDWNGKPGTSPPRCCDGVPLPLAGCLRWRRKAGMPELDGGPSGRHEPDSRRVVDDRRRLVLELLQAGNEAEPDGCRRLRRTRRKPTEGLRGRVADPDPDPGRTPRTQRRGGDKPGTCCSRGRGWGCLRTNQKPPADSPRVAGVDRKRSLRLRVRDRRRGTGCGFLQQSQLAK